MAGRYRHLLEAAVPSRYDLSLTFRELSAGAAFEGVVRIELELLAETQEVRLHAKCLQVLEAFAAKTVDDGEANWVSATEVVKDDITESVCLRFTDALSGRISLRCRYQGQVSGPLLGIYHCSFEDGSVGVSTHFEPTYARYALPCIDEPRGKARFRVAIAAPRGLTVLSNMPEVASNEHAGPDLVEHQFEETPPMSTYLLALSIGNFGVIRLPAESAPVPMALYAPLGKEEQGRFALEVAALSLRHFADFFRQPFPLPKLDLVVPPAFPIGGMENWGLISLTNRALLEESASLAKKRSVAGLVSHEVSHMWFGNLVTPVWWDDLWLKEGFASWVNLLPLDAHFPTWRVWDRWATDLLFGGAGGGGALEIDQYKETHAVEVAVDHPSEVQEIFDALSYDKGSAIVNMLYHALGRDNFQQGLAAWFERHKFANSTTRDLWAALAEASGQPVAEMMESWTKQEGFPVLDVAPDASGAAWRVSQRRFGLSGATEGSQGPMWIVPLAPVHQEEEKAEGEPQPEKTVLSGAEAALVQRGAWVKLNAGQRSPFRVRYAPEALEALVAGAAGGADARLVPLDRVGLINDAFALLRAGQLGADALLGALRRLLPAEPDPLVWSAALGPLQRLLGVFAERVPALRAFAAELLVPQKTRLGWSPPASGESEDDTMLRPVLLSVLGLCRDDVLVREAVEQTEAYLAAGKGVLMAKPAPRADVRGAALRIGLSSSASLWEPLRAKLAASVNTEERDQLLAALAGHSDRAAVEAFVEAGLGGELPAMEWATLFGGLSRNVHHASLAWTMLVKHWDAVYAAWGQSQFKMKAIVTAALHHADASEVEAFFAAHPCGVTAKTVRRCLEALAADAALAERSAEVQEFLSSEFASKM